MSDAIDRAAEVIRAAIDRQADIVADGLHLDVQGVITPRWIAEALATNGLLSPAPLREEWGEAFVVATWRHTRWVESHAPVPGEPMLRGSPSADALHTECAVCREVLVPARFERVPVDRAEGDGRDEREPTVPASQLRAFARLCVDGGDMTPAAARMLDRIIAGDGRAEK